jgi:hypothetical protein
MKIFNTEPKIKSDKFIKLIKLGKIKEILKSVTLERKGEIGEKIIAKKVE